MSKKNLLAFVVSLIYLSSVHASNLSTRLIYMLGDSGRAFLTSKLSKVIPEQDISTYVSAISKSIKNNRRSINNYVYGGFHHYVPNLTEDLKIVRAGTTDPFLKDIIDDALAILAKNEDSVTGEEIIHFSEKLEVIVSKISGDTKALENVCKSCFANGSISKSSKMRKAFLGPKVKNSGGNDKGLVRYSTGYYHENSNIENKGLIRLSNGWYDEKFAEEHLKGKGILVEHSNGWYYY